MSKIQWSLVCPIKDEVDVLKFSLPSVYALQPDEVIIPIEPNSESIEMVKRIARKCRYQKKTRIIVLREKTPDWRFRQAYARRKGFQAARNDLICGATGEQKMKITEKLKRKLAVSFAMHEKPVSLFIKTIKGHVFVDVGANYGYYSMLLHGNFEKVYAFEPIPSIKELKSNLEKFDSVECVRKAVSNVDGQLVELSYHGSHGFAETVTLASFFPNTEIDLIKVDVEGGEWRVLEGAELILERIKSWVVELHDPSRKEELENWFVSRGYSVRWLDFAFRGSQTANHIHAWRG